MYACVRESFMYIQVTPKEIRLSDTLNLELQIHMSLATWVLLSEYRSFPRIVHAEPPVKPQSTFYAIN